MARPVCHFDRGRMNCPCLEANGSKLDTSLYMRTYSDVSRSEEHTSELQSHLNLECRLLLEKKKPRGRNRSLLPNILRANQSPSPSLLRANNRLPTKSATGRPRERPLRTSPPRTLMPPHRLT